MSQVGVFVMNGHDPRGPPGGLRRTAGRYFISDAILASVIAVLLAATLACAAALAPPIWAAVSKGFSTANNNNPRVCAAIENEKDRLACFDKYAEGLMKPPAKGAFAPVQAFGRKISQPDR
jgi:hypothetical protein